MRHIIKKNIGHITRDSIFSKLWFLVVCGVQVIRRGSEWRKKSNEKIENVFRWRRWWRHRSRLHTRFNWTICEFSLCAPNINLQERKKSEPQWAGVSESFQLLLSNALNCIEYAWFHSFVCHFHEYQIIYSSPKYTSYQSVRTEKCRTRLKKKKNVHNC